MPLTGSVPAARGTARATLTFWGATLFAVSAACTGQIASNGNGTTTGGAGANGGNSTSGSNTGGPTGNDGMTTTPAPPTPADFVAEPATLRRLTVPQLHNSLTDLFGADLITTQFEADTALSGFASIGAARVQLSASFVEQLENAALEASGKAIASAQSRAALVSCTPAGMSDDACTTMFITRFGRRAWRRPLTDAEVSRYVAVAKNAQTELKDFYQGLRYAIVGLLESPNFIYRVEVPAPGGTPGSKVGFDDYQLATRLSYFLWNTTPDDQLLDAAESRQLTQGDGLAKQTDRLLRSPRAAQAMKTFFAELYRLGSLDDLIQLPSSFPAAASATLGASMREETVQFLTDIAFTQKADFRDAFDARTTFVNAEMAKLYGMSGVAAGAGTVKVTQPADSLRAGLLGQASFLAINSQPTRSSPTRRGKFIREMMLCEAVPAPPPGGVPAFPEAAPGTTRERLTQHRTDPACKSCHEFMDPIGLGLENFDGIGAFRTSEAGKPIDASGALDGVNYTGPVELAHALRNHPESANCVATNLYRYAVGHVDTTGEEPAIKLLEDAFSSQGFHFDSLLGAMTKSAGFTTAAATE